MLRHYLEVIGLKSKRVLSGYILNIEALTILSSLYVRDYSNVEATQVINVTLGGGYTIVSTAITYCASKFYVSEFTEGLAHELKANGAEMQAKVFHPLQPTTNLQFSRSTLTNFHADKEMAQFMFELYAYDKVVGIVDGYTYEFEGKDLIYSFQQDLPFR